jgi:uncharacterized DUF497 family protein
MIFDWDPEKEKWLKENRGVSFHHVLFHIQKDDLLDIREHTNKDKYPNQKLLIVRMNDYVYVVPFVQEQDTLFLKTIIPSRKETKRYLQ